MWSNGLTTLSEGVFDGLSNLEELRLSGNELTALPPRAFAGLSSLQSLGLDYNDLSALPDAIFAGLGGLRSLSLGGNGLTALSEGAFDGLSNLEDLRLSRNELTTLPPGVFAGLDRLEFLALGDNDLAALPVGVFAGLDRLELLALGDNDLAALPVGVFAGLSDLEELRLHSNGLTELSQGAFSGLVGLKRLYLRDNDLTTLSAGVFAGLSSLQSLDVEDNPGSPFELWLRRTDSWCTVQQAEFINFQRNGKTVSICGDDGVLTYISGHLGAEPELRYSGSVLATFGGPSVNATEVSYRNLADLAGWTDDPEESELLKELACANATNGFIEIDGRTGFFSSTVYVFRNGGWQYEVGGEWGRTFNVSEGTDEYEEVANHAEYFMTARSPDEQVHCLN